MEEPTSDATPEDEPFSGTPCDPVDAELAAYLAEWEPQPLFDVQEEMVRRITEPGVVTSRMMLRFEYDGEWLRRQMADYQFIVERDNAEIAAENARRAAVPEWPIDWRTYRG